MKNFLTFLILISFAASVYAEVISEKIEYKEGETTLEGHLVHDDAIQGKRPGIIVVHNWLGFGPIANKRADTLAELGYIALAVDIYGKGVRPKDNDEAAHQAMLYLSDRKLMRRRALAGLKTLQEHPLCDREKTAAIGYCFGGTVVLEMARSGEEITGVASFHGGLKADGDLMARKDMKAKVLVLHGANDPHVPQKDVDGFISEMKVADADWQVIIYGGAVHSFTNQSAGNDPSKGVAYNKQVDERSWEAMKQFFNEIFR